MLYKPCYKEYTFRTFSLVNWSNQNADNDAQAQHNFTFFGSVKSINLLTGQFQPSQHRMKKIGINLAEWQNF